MAKLTHFSTNPSTHNRIAHSGQLRHFMFCHGPAARRRSGRRGVRRSHRAWGAVSPVSLPAGSGATLFRPRGFAHSLHRHARTCSGHDERRQGAPAPNARSCACEGGPAPDRDTGWDWRLSRPGLAGGDPRAKCHEMSCSVMFRGHAAGLAGGAFGGRIGHGAAFPRFHCRPARGRPCFARIAREFRTEFSGARDAARKPRLLELL